MIPKLSTFGTGAAIGFFSFIFIESDKFTIDSAVLTGFFTLAGAIAGGLITYFTTVRQTASEEKRAGIKRTEDIEDRNFNIKKEVYMKVLQDCYDSAFHRHMGISNKILTKEESRERNNNLMFFEIFASEPVREVIKPLVKLFGKEVKKDSTEYEKYMQGINKGINDLTNAIKNDLDIS